MLSINTNISVNDRENIIKKIQTEEFVPVSISQYRTTIYESLAIDKLPSLEFYRYKISADSFDLLVDLKKKQGNPRILFLPSSKIDISKMTSLYAQRIEDLMEKEQEENPDETLDKFDSFDYDSQEDIIQDDYADGISEKPDFEQFNTITEVEDEFGFDNTDEEETSVTSDFGDSFDENNAEDFAETDDNSEEEETEEFKGFNKKSEDDDDLFAEFEDEESPVEEPNLATSNSEDDTTFETVDDEADSFAKDLLASLDSTDMADFFEGSDTQGESVPISRVQGTQQNQNLVQKTDANAERGVTRGVQSSFQTQSLQPVSHPAETLIQNNAPSKGEVPTDLRKFLKQYPNSEYSFVLQYFEKREVDKAIKMGKILRKGTKLTV